VRAVDQIAATSGKVALRYGPLIYNIEKVDQDIARPLAGNSALTAEWRGDLLGGAVTIGGKFADGSKLLAVPNFARLNRDQGLPPEAGPISGDPSLYMGPNARQRTGPPDSERRREAPVPASIVWMRQA
jgi:hypothetical protein